MRDDDPQADNLLARLFSYTPREGRDPLEDFCTETLAWCLRVCRKFRSRFFGLFPRLKGVKDYSGDVEVDTQFALHGERFDLVVRSAPGFSFVIVLESKI